MCPILETEVRKTLTAGDYVNTWRWTKGVGHTWQLIGLVMLLAI